MYKRQVPVWPLPQTAMAGARGEVFRVKYITMYKMNFFWTSALFALPPARLSCSRQAGTQGDRAHYVASVNPGRGPWHVLCAFKVTKSVK